MHYALLENGFVKAVITTDAPDTHKQRANFRNIPQDGDPQRWVGVRAEDLPSVESELEDVPEAPSPERKDNLYTESRTVKMPAHKPDPSPPPKKHGRK